MSIVKGFYKIEPFLSDEQKKDFEGYAVQYAKFFRLYFKIITINTETKDLLISAKQEKKPTNTPYFTAKEIIGETKKFFSDYFPTFDLKVSAEEYSHPKSDEITPELLQTLIQKHKLKIKDIQKETGLEMSNLSMWINGKRPMSKIVQNMFYYYFKTKGLILNN
ncbi:hypothetical protein AB4865_07345 [Capnocytophaga sp. ARDL2]|uniref:hypothetical protein n=1 Tax=Capnocytophaga sp. ARDL2 TaxID=3238809 RepID=UPI003556B798